MGPADKALLRLDGQTLVARAAARLGAQVATVILSANGDPARFAGLGLTVLADAIPGQGPLAGIRAGLEAAAALGATHLATIAVDTPFFPRDLVWRLAAGLPQGHVAVARSASGLHPTAALWPVAALPAVTRALDEGHFRLEAAARTVGLHAVEFAETDPDPFFNVNTPEDLARAATFRP